MDKKLLLLILSKKITFQIPLKIHRKTRKKMLDVAENGVCHSRFVPKLTVTWDWI